MKEKLDTAAKALLLIAITAFVLAALMLCALPAVAREEGEPPAAVKISNAISIAELAALEAVEILETVEAPEVPEEISVPQADASSVEVAAGIHATRGGVELAAGEPVRLGDTIHLTGQVENPDGLPCVMQWQEMAGGGWRAIDGATSAAYSFTLSEENLTRQYRLLLAVDLSTVTAE